MDPLTDVYNRRGLQHILTREIRIADRKDHPLTAAVLDIDNFKTINDTLGHLCGDIVLKEVTKRIKESLRISDYVGRIGGDEFLLLLPETTLEDGSRLAERLRLSVAGMHMQVSETTNVRITVSIGLAQITNQVISVSDIVGLVDHLLQESKNEGKNQVQFETEGKAPAFAIHKLRYQPDYASDLRRSELFYAAKQGIHDLRSDAITGLEFLSRMRHDSIAMPNDFFRAAQENNMVTLVDHHCFNACLKASSDMTAGGTHHINILPSTIMDAPIDWLVEKLSSHEKRYCLEICEQQGMGNSVHFKDMISVLKQCGIEIAIDDVGFGNTCLETILLIEPDILKIDKRCVIGISQQESMQKTLRHILEIGKDLNARVIAEGIETREDLETLLSLGVEYGQGCHWGYPS
jgi:diguanylate cyclase (GGDEF)-like protein